MMIINTVLIIPGDHVEDPDVDRWIILKSIFEILNRGRGLDRFGKGYI